MPILAETNENDPDQPTKSEKGLLIKLVYNSTLWSADRETVFEMIENCTDYREYERLQFWLDNLQMPFDQIVNPNAGDVNKHIKQIMSRE